MTIRKAGSERSNLELTNSLRSNFVAAQEDYSPPLSTENSDADSPKQGDLSPESNHVRPSLSVWTTRDGSDYYIPTIDWSSSGLSEPADSYDVTVKLFYLPNACVDDRAQHTKEAVALVQKELGLQTIDLLIVSFPGMSFEGDCEWEADKHNAVQGNDEEETKTWPALEELHAAGTVKRLGIAEFGSDKLERFLARVKVRPEVDQINVRDCCNVPPPLAKLAKERGIELLTHNDCMDILPSGTLRELLGQGPNDAGVLSESKRGIDGMKGEVTPQWVAKYTAIVRDRGVIENKGYFAVAELKE